MASGGSGGGDVIVEVLSEAIYRRSSMADYVTADSSLPRSLDVQINVSLAQTAERKDLSLLCVACENLGLQPDENRVRFYSDLDSVENDFTSDSEPYRAATAFFSQSPRPTKLAIGEIFLTDQHAQIVAAEMSAAQITALTAISAGNLKITITSGGTSTAYSLNAMDFSSATTLALIAAVIQAKLTAGSVPATCSVVTYPGGDQQIQIRTTAAGDGVSISYPIDSGTGTFAGTALLMTAATGGKVLDGYSPSLSATHGTITGAEMTDVQITALMAVSDGNLKLTIAGVDYSLNAMDFSSASTLELIASVIQAALTSATAPATCSVVSATGGAQEIVIETTGTGILQTMAYPVTTGTGTFVGAMLNMTALTGGVVVSGTVPSDIAGELQNIQNAANASDYFIYGWCLDMNLRDVDIQLSAATWAGAQAQAIMPLVSNDASATDAAYTTDLASELGSTSNKRVVPIWHDNAQQYPDVSILAYMLSTNYRLKDSTRTAKFKVLPEITTVTLTETEYAALLAKGYNCYTNMGGDVYTYREGSAYANSWYMDTVINVDNFVEDLSVNVYNVFLRNKKVPFTRAGVLLLTAACKKTGEQYVYNGSFADREVEDDTSDVGYSVTPAVVVEPTPIYQSSASDRAARIGPPIAITCQDAGAIHSIELNVEIVV